jgi:hypothetical protein
MTDQPIPAPAPSPDDAINQVLAQRQENQRLVAMATEGTALFASRFVVTVHQGMVRIAFGDQLPIPGAPVRFIAAIALSGADAFELIRVIAAMGSEVPPKEEPLPGEAAKAEAAAEPLQ